MLSRKHIPETEAVGSNFANFGYALDRCNANFNVHDARGHPTILAEATWLLCGGRTAPKVPAREVLPLRDLVQVIAKGCDLVPECLTTFRTTVWEDNMGALTLANLDPGQTTSRSRHYDSKVHWFRSHLSRALDSTPEAHLEPNGIYVKKVESKFQLADLFTKPLILDTFGFLRNLLMGW